MKKPSWDRLLVSIEDAEVAQSQHKTPCRDCPWARKALSGWLGNLSVTDWVGVAHSDSYAGCHTLLGAQCAGLAIYRRNTCKRVEAPLLVLPSDHEMCFSNQMEFTAHHKFGLPTAVAGKE